MQVDLATTADKDEIEVWSFNSWMVEQFGPRATIAKSDDHLLRVIAEGEQAQQEMLRRQEWDAKYQAGLYAWNVKDANKR